MGYTGCGTGNASIEKEYVLAEIAKAIRSGCIPGKHSFTVADSIPNPQKAP
jgi:hypothetical protein